LDYFYLSALLSEDMHFRILFFNKICFKYPYANPLSVPKESEKNILNQTTYPPTPPRIFSNIGHIKPRPYYKVPGQK
jgi:hypothetical protein